MTILEYMGYHAAVKLDKDEKLLHGEVLRIRDVIFFEADTMEQLEKEFRSSINDYLAVCAERGREPSPGLGHSDCHNGL